MKRVAITGATSTIGVALIEECIKNNIEVLAFARPNSSKVNKIPASNLVNVITCGLDEYKQFEPKIGKNEDYRCDVLFHLAWEATGGDAARNSIKAQVKNIEYSLDAVEMAERLGCSTYVGAGSQAEYGRTEEILTEDTVTKPETPYGMAKLCTGQMTRLACKQKGIKHIWPRILSVYGPNCQAHTVLNHTITELLNNRRPSLSGGEQIWDFLYTEDAARALLLLADRGNDGEIYVVGYGESRRLREYLLDTKCVIDSIIDGDVKEMGLGDKPYGENTVMHLACDISKLKKDTGFEPRISFDEGIRRTIDWIRNNEKN